MRLLIIVVCLLLILVSSCDLAADTADTSKEGGEGAVGVAEKMSKGTLGDELEDE